MSRLVTVQLSRMLSSCVPQAASSGDGCYARCRAVACLTLFIRVSPSDMLSHCLYSQQLARLAAVVTPLRP